MGSGTSSGGQGGLGQGPLEALKAGREVAVLPLLPPPPPGSYLPRVESRVLTVAEPLPPLRSPAGPVLLRGTPAPARGQLGAGEAEAARGQSTGQAPRVSEVSGGCLGPERANEGGGSRGLAGGDGSLSYLPASKEVGQGNGMNSFSSFICPFFSVLSGRLLIHFFPQARSSVLVLAPNPWSSFFLSLVATEAFTLPWGFGGRGGRGFRGVGSNIPFLGCGGGEEKSCVILQREGGRLSHYSLAHRPPAGEGFWVVGFALSGFMP